MAFGGRKGELVSVIGCGTNRLEGARLVSSVVGIWGERNSLCQLPRSGWSFGRAGLGAKATYPVLAVFYYPSTP